MILKFFLLILLISIILEVTDAAFKDLKNFTYKYDREKESKNEYWMNLGKEEIEKSLKLTENKRAKNVILFLGDGMGISTVTASRILKGQLNNKPGEEGYLFFERNLPNTALIKTYNVDKLVPDSAGTGTAYLSGVKSNFEVIGVNAAIFSNEKDCKKIQNNKVISIMELARRAGKAIGVVTTTRITHATPAASYAHVANRNHEYELPEETKTDSDCKDIASQLIEDEPGISFNVILGGGRKNFLPSTDGGSRNDTKDLIKKWKDTMAEKFKDEKKYKYIKTVDELNSINPNEVEHLFGLFNDNHLSYNNLKKAEEPSLKEMSDMAIKILSKYKNGFVLLVEGGRIDMASHENNAFLALHETVHFDETIESANKLIKKDDTLVLVTADHSHTLVINGYSPRGTNIFGVSEKLEVDDENKDTNKRFTILGYGNGPGKESKERPNPIEEEKLGTSEYKNYAAVRQKDSTHGGEDVALYSNSWPNLVRGVKEQNYVAHVIQYTACLGQYANEPHCLDESDSQSSIKIWIYIIVALFVCCLFAAFFVSKRNHWI